MNSKKKPFEIVCRCNNISKEEIEQAISDGAKTLNEIFDLTTAGVGACGGSCRKKIIKILENKIKNQNKS